MSASLDSRDDRNANVSYVFENLHAFVVNLAPNAGIDYVTKRGPFDTGNEVPACARQDHDLIFSILSDPVKGVDKFCMVLRCESEGSAFAVKFCYQHPTVISCKLQTAICVEVVSFNWVHGNFLVVSPFDRMKVVNLPLANHTVKFRNSLRVSAGSTRMVSSPFKWGARVIPCFSTRY